MMVNGCQNQPVKLCVQSQPQQFLQQQEFLQQPQCLQWPRLPQPCLQQQCQQQCQLLLWEQHNQQQHIVSHCLKYLLI